jgi:small Trp-rich protein
MWMMWLGLVLLLLKLAGIWPVADLAWGWVVAPFIGALIWFELFERRLGLDKKKAFDELDRAKQDRIKKTMAQAKRPRKR